MKALNLLINGFVGACSEGLIPSLLEDKQVEKIYWLRDHVGVNLPAYGENVNLIDTVAALRQEKGMARNSKYETLSDELQSCYSKIRPLCVKMMDRIERYGPRVAYSERMRIFDQNFFYCLSFLREKQIDAFISSGVPHEITDYVFAEICRILEIKSLVFYQVQTDLITTVGHYTELGTECQRYWSTLSHNDLVLREKKREAMKLQYRPLEEEGPIQHFYMDKSVWKKNRKRNTQRAFRRLKGKASKLEQSLFSANAWKYAWYLTWGKNVVEKRETKALWRAYHERCVFPTIEDLSKPFVLLLLHYQPEMTTCPLAEEFVDQYLIARLLLSSLPPGIRVFVKEHPVQRIIGRSVNYYDHFPKDDRLVMIHEAYSSNELQKHASAIATATGTAGFEAVWKGRLVLLFGNAYYQAAPGVHRVQSVSSGRTASEAILNSQGDTSEREIEEYMDQLLGQCAVGNLYDYYYSYSEMDKSVSQNMAAIRNEITTWLENWSILPANEIAPR